MQCSCMDCLKRVFCCGKNEGNTSPQSQDNQPVTYNAESGKKAEVIENKPDPAPASTSSQTVEVNVVRKKSSLVRKESGNPKFVTFDESVEIDRPSRFTDIPKSSKNLDRPIKLDPLDAIERETSKKYRIEEIIGKIDDVKYQIENENDREFEGKEKELMEEIDRLRRELMTIKVEFSDAIKAKKDEGYGALEKTNMQLHKRKFSLHRPALDKEELETGLKQKINEIMKEIRRMEDEWPLRPQTVDHERRRQYVDRLRRLMNRLRNMEVDEFEDVSEFKMEAMDRCQNFIEVLEKYRMDQ